MKLNRKTLLIILAVTLLSFFVRLLNIDKQCGLWYDEMLTYLFSTNGSVIDIMKTLWKEDFHMPLYYFFVGGWVKLFGSNDVVLRLSSVFWGVLTIPAMFFLGKTYRDEKLGIWLAVFSSVSPILIYLSQEFRFYSMLVFFSTVAITYLLKLTTKANKKNALIFGLSNIVILYIYTIGIVFVGLEFAVLFFHYLKKDKEHLKNYFKSASIFALLSLPYLIILSKYLYASKTAILDPFCWGATNIGILFLLVNDMFSPFILRQMNGSDASLLNLISNPVGLIVFIFWSIPTLFLAFGVVKSFFYKNQKFSYLAAILIPFLSVEIFLAFSGNLVLYTKYLIVAFPILLLFALDGILSVKNESLKKSLIFIPILIFSLNILNFNNMPSFSTRANGCKTVSNALNELKLDKNDYILYTTKTDLLKKYVDNANFIDFDTAGIFYLDKSKQEAKKLFSDEFIKETTKNNSYEKLIPFLTSAKPSPELQAYLKFQLKKIPNNGRFILVVDDREKISELSNFINMIKFAQESQKGIDFYRKNIFDIVYNKIELDMKQILSENKDFTLLETKSVEGPGKNNKKWKILIYQKKD